MATSCTWRSGSRASRCRRRSCGRKREGERPGACRTSVPRPPVGVFARSHSFEYDVEHLALPTTVFFRIHASGDLKVPLLVDIGWGVTLEERDERGIGIPHVIDPGAKLRFGLIIQTLQEIPDSP